MIPSILFALAMVQFVSPAVAFLWTFSNTPSQCEELTITITPGAGGESSYTLLIVPVGHSPLLGGVEVRQPMELPFNTSSSLTFVMPYPEGSQFVAVVSDSTTFGNGGTSAAITVAAGNSSSCFDATKVETQPWVFNFGTTINPYSASLIECSPLRIWWAHGQGIRGTAQFQGVIPGGQSFEIQAGPITTQSEQGIGFQWVPTLANGTIVIVVGGDENGQGTGGSQQFTVLPGDAACLNNTSPSSTLGPPAGGTSIPTSTHTGSSTTSFRSSHRNIALIIVVVVVVCVLLAIGVAVLLHIIRLRQGIKKAANHVVDLGGDNDEKIEVSVGGTQTPSSPYRITPFCLPGCGETRANDDSASSFRTPPSNMGSRPVNPRSTRAKYSSARPGETV